tara:strand:- start:59 stop:1279 length:1221 start_codon:yes stop_codon:yes gene_type:complete
MSFLFITRLYSGFESSLEKMNWQPEGVPTIYNLFETIANKYDTSIIFTAKDSGSTYTSNWTKRKDESIKLKNLNANIVVLSGKFYFPSFIPRKLAMILRDIRQLFKIIIFIKKNNPNIVYCDSANVVIAFCLTKFFPNKPIVVRVLGVCSFWRSILNSKRLVHKIYKFSFKGKFASVIGTQDGSGIEYWFDEVLNKKVPRYVLLNGVTKNKINTSIRKRKKILFVGRLEDYKGIIIFINAMINVLKKYKGSFSIIIIGDGTLYDKAFSLTKSSGFVEQFTFLRSIPHNDVLNYYSNSDIYVSANTDGNLINTNLEAISSSCCMIIPSPQEKKLIDIKTYQLLQESVLYYKVNSVEDLSKKILYLLNYPDNIEKFKNKISNIKTNFIRTWKERMDEEFLILKSLIDK